MAPGLGFRCLAASGEKSADRSVLFRDAREVRAHHVDR
jgi:hypothetical protein